MNNTLILLSLFILLASTESKRCRHKHGHRNENERSQQSEERNEYNDYTSTGNNRIGPRPAYNSNTDNRFDDNDQDGEEITRNLPYPRPFQPDLQQSNRFGSYGSDMSRTNYPRPVAPNLEETNRRLPYNDYDTYRQRSYEIGDFGNGHHNVNTFNIHKKIIYIDNHKRNI